MIAPVELIEYGDAEVSLDHHGLARLRAVARGVLDITPTDSAGRWALRAGSRVGTIVTPDVRVLIRPKVPAANLFHMMESDGDPIPLGQEEFDYDRTGDLVPAFATFFARHLERALARGVVRAHVEHDELIAGIRGRVALQYQLRSGGLPVPVECVFDEHTVDTRLNRIVAAATARLLHLPGVTPATRRALLGAISAFDGISPFTPADVSRSITFTRLDAHFKPVERLARLLLEGAGILDASGSTGASTFILDMNRLFETFVESRVRRYLRGRAEIRGQYPAMLDHGHHVRMRPDIVALDDGVVVHVADAKYKMSGDGFGREADYYQLLAYCISLRLCEGTLIYCQHDGPVPTREVNVVGPPDVRLVSLVVKLSGSPTQLEEQMRTLAEDVWMRSTSATLARARH